MRILISNKIYLYDFPEAMKNTIKKGLTIPNILYEQMLRRMKFGNNAKWRKALYGLKKEFKYYTDNDGVIIIGRGNEEKIHRFLKANNVTEYEVEHDLWKKTETVNLKGEIKLRDYQEGVVEQILQHPVGVCKLSTGFGKTIIALKLIEKTKLPTLIIVHQDKELVKYKNDLLRHYNYKAGVIQGDKADIQQITIGSIATLCRRDLKQLEYTFGMVVVDEVQTMISDKRLVAIQTFKPIRLYSMSGTPQRDDSLTDAIFFSFGDIVVDKELPQKAPVVQIVKSNIDIPIDDYADMVASQIENAERNKLIIDLAVKQIDSGRKVLILTKRTAHYRELFNGLKSRYKAFCIESGLKVHEKNKQSDLLEHLGQGGLDFDCLLGSFAMLGVGANLPALDTLIFAGDLRGQVMNRQSVGRILRLMEGKQDPLVIDIDDNLNKIFHSQAVARRRLYKDCGWEIK